MSTSLLGSCGVRKKGCGESQAEFGIGIDANWWGRGVAHEAARLGNVPFGPAVFNPRLVPVIAHDRAGFGGGLATIGVLLTVCAVYSRPSRSFHEAVAIAGVAGFGCAIGTHYVEGYVNPLHLAPAFAGAALFGVSMGCEIIATRTRKSSGPTAAAAVERRVETS
jgi:hypothetical protein